MMINSSIGSSAVTGVCRKIGNLQFLSLMNLTVPRMRLKVEVKLALQSH